MRGVLSRAAAPWWMMALLVAAGCGGDTVAGPEPEAAYGEDLPVFAEWNPWVTVVHGRGKGVLPNGIVQRPWARVVERADGTVVGAWGLLVKIPEEAQLPFSGMLYYEVEVDCLVEEGGLAWMSGGLRQVKKTDPAIPFPTELGLPFMAQVRDRDADPSLGDGFFGPAAAWGTANCAEKPAAPPLAPGLERSGRGFTIRTR